ncbi:hypothetical protein M3P05_09440 [Sansalvadorimonas sp. 2012CJ34-2]|uniref:Uncharacterized protein n=1 Tax=Parendozoicomonas callyspongiae TaxID=2942213 RepID=A0ABT0PFK2_9GAMM|nr:hypothetical protein [Sansalvadorimonas sp. 2012CJ34-2]MCL6270155.1 hypothetical protein [Sansalvadorimonas sp. 2012CJ34-2]
MAGLAGQTCAYNIKIYVNGIKDKQELKVEPSPPLPDLPSLASEVLEDWLPFKKLIFSLAIMSLIETAGKTLLDSHNHHSGGSIHFYPRKQRLPDRMFFQQPNGPNRSLILFYEGLYEYNPSYPKQLTIFMSCKNIDIIRTTESSTTCSELPIATVAYEIDTAPSGPRPDPYPKLRSINIKTHTRLTKPGMITPTYGLTGLFSGLACQSKSSPPDRINQELIQKGRFPSPITPYPALGVGISTFTPNPVVTDSPPHAPPTSTTCRKRKK